MKRLGGVFPARMHPAANNIEEMRRLMRKYVDFRLEYPLKSLDFWRRCGIAAG